MTEHGSSLRPGWTTGACAAAAAKAAWTALASGHFPDPVTIPLPGGQRPAFALACEHLGPDEAMAGIVKDAGDDPDVTHGALVQARLRRAPAGAGIVFRAGRGVGTVTLPGLPIPPGEPAINPVPRRMIAAALAEVGEAHPDVVVEIAIAAGEEIATRTMNGRLGIVGGLSVLGTTGIVVPYSCAAWIASIHRGIDVARATGLRHVAGATGRTSEQAIAALDGLPDQALIDMGDFVGGMLKYLRRHPVERVTVAGGFAKLTKLAQGLADLHSKRGGIDRDWLAARVRALGGSGPLVAAVGGANSALEVLTLCQGAGLPIAETVAAAARQVAEALVDGAPVAVDVALFDREGRLLARAWP